MERPAAVIFALLLVGSAGAAKLNQPEVVESSQQLSTKDGKVSANLIYSASEEVILTCTPTGGAKKSDISKFIILKDGTEVVNSASVDNVKIKITDWKATAVYTCKLEHTSGDNSDTSDLSNEMVILAWGPALGSDLKVSKVTETGADVTWDPAEKGFTKYVIGVTPSDKVKTTEVQNDATKPSTSLSGLAEKTVYTVTVSTSFTVAGYTTLGKEKAISFITTAGAERPRTVPFVLVVAALALLLNIK